MDAEDIKFTSLLEDKRHKELKGKLDSLLAEFGKDRSDVSVVRAIESQSKIMERFANAIQNLPKPEVNVTTNQQVVISAIEKLGSIMLDWAREFRDYCRKEEPKKEEPKPKEWDFKIKRDYGGYIQSITAKEK